jgi:hypothetical protein
MEGCFPIREGCFPSRAWAEKSADQTQKSPVFPGLGQSSKVMRRSMRSQCVRFRRCIAGRRPSYWFFAIFNQTKLLSFVVKLLALNDQNE